MKTYRKTIRINGKQVKSPRFSSQGDANRWYQAKQREKLFVKEGLHAPIDKRTTLNEYYLTTWLPDRRKNYPPSTYYSDIQRFEKYIKPTLGSFRVAKINQLQIRSVLKEVVSVHKCSIATRNKVRALLSKIFNDAMNEESPLRSDNPASNISFTDAREGTKEPVFIKKEKDILQFIKIAKSLGKTYYVYACIMLMTGLRKSEIIPLKWEDFDEDDSQIKINKRFMQAANKIVLGLKKGRLSENQVPIPDELVRVLAEHRKKSDFQSDDDFILARPDGKNFSPREIATLHGLIRSKSGVKVTPHGLRHTYGREFVKNGGSMKALQTILGHTSSATTELYSRLAGKTVNQFRNTVSYKNSEESDD